jgi:thiamine pyrophosphokinase
MRALIVAAGRVPDRLALDAAWPGWAEGVDLVVAADAGAAAAEKLGLRPDLAVGDFDSLDADGLDRLRAQGIPIEVAPAAKDESDTELAILAAIRRGADRLTIVGGLGGRPDHLLANIGLLGHPALSDRPIELLDDRTRVTLVRGPARHALAGRVGDLVSLLPLGPGVEGVTTSGLRWTLTNEPLPAGPARGLSNIRSMPTASVEVSSGWLIAIETTDPPVASGRLPG